MIPTPCALQVRDHVEQHDLLGIGQRGGRLVEDHRLGVDGQRAGDLDHLLVGDGQVADPRPRRRSRTFSRFRIASVSVVELVPVDPAEALARQLAEIDVLGHRQLVGEAQLLVDEDDALGLRLQRRGHDGRLLVDDRCVPSLGWWMPPSTFIRVDLPAPFSPIRACTSPGMTSKRHAVERAHAGKGLDDVFETQGRGSSVISSAPPCPCG